MFSYATPSLFQSDLSQAQLGLCCDAARPLQFEGRVVAHLPILRFSLRALGELIWSSDDDSLIRLDPIVTAHPDGLIFEAFSSDLTGYGRLAVDLDTFDIQGAPIWGTSNVDFTGWLWAALGEMRSSRETWFRLSAGGFEVKTLGAGGRFEPKVNVPVEWFRAFLELQAALRRPATRLELEPVEMLAPIRFLRHSKARISPRGMRYECAQGHWRIVLEPWEETFPLTCLGTEDRVIRTWGRQRLRWIEPLLPFASRVQVHLCGRAMPHFYELHLPGMRFLLGLTGWGRQAFDSEAGYSLWRGLPQPVDEEQLAQRLRALSENWVLPEQADLDTELIRRGLALGDFGRPVTRYRPLTHQPLDLEKLYPPDTRLQQASQLEVEVGGCQLQETRKTRKLLGQERELIYRDYRIEGQSQGHALELVVSEREQILFGRCGCEFFQTHLLQRGPCAHLLALFEKSRELRVQLPNSRSLGERAPDAE